jgi:hypothetical protein
MNKSNAVLRRTDHGNTSIACARNAGEMQQHGGALKTALVLLQNLVVPVLIVDSLIQLLRSTTSIILILQKRTLVWLISGIGLGSESLLRLRNAFSCVQTATENVMLWVSKE